jgi:hypothetical protein
MSVYAGRCVIPLAQRDAHNAADMAPVASDCYDRVTCTDLELWGGPAARISK